MAQAAVDTSYKQEPDAQNLDHIPGDYGMPVLGKTFQILADMAALIHENVTKFGEVSRTNFGGQKGLLVVGPENLKQIYLDTDRNFSTEMGYAERLGRFYRGGLLLRDFDDHKMSRRIFQTAFKNDAMQGYVDIMNPLYTKYLNEINPVDFHFFPFIKTSLLRAVAKVFAGIDDMGEEAEKLNDAFLDLNDALTAIIREDIPLPWLKFHKGKKAQKYVHDFVRKLIQQKRAEDGTDMLSFMCKETTEDGHLFSDEDIIQHYTFLLFGAHDTTTSALTHVMYRLAVHPEWQEKVREEALSLNKPYLEYEDLDKVKNMDMVFDETLRLHPSVQLMTRRTVRECEIGGYRVPANTMLFIPPTYNHKMTEYWTNPEKFDPERFSPEREEHKQHAFQYLPFGGGGHKCIGMHFAKMQAKLFMHQVLQRYKWRAPDNYFPKLEYVPLPKPADDLPLILERL